MKSFPLPMPQRSRRKKNGSTLAVVMVVMALLAAFVSAAYSFSSSNTIVVQRANSYTAASGVAEAAMELVYARWRDVVSYVVPGSPALITPNYNARVFIDPSANRLARDITKVTPDELGIPDSVVKLLGLPALGTNTPMGTITIQTVDVYGRRYGNYDSDGRCTDDASILIDPNRVYATSTSYPPLDPITDYAFNADNVSAQGLPGVNVIYEVKVRIPYTTRSSRGTQSLNLEISRRFTKFYATTAQYAIFTQDQFELFPGSNMDVTGRVHTNNEMYFGAVGSNSVLKFTEAITYAGTYHDRDFLTYLNGGYSGGATDKTQSGEPQRVDPLPVAGIAPSALAPYDATSNPTYNNTSLREIIERPVAVNPGATSYDERYFSGPVSPQQNAIEAARLYNKAGLKILISYDSSGRVSNVEVRGLTPKGEADGPSYGDGTDINKRVRAALNNVVSSDAGGFQGDPLGVPRNGDGGRRTNLNDLRESNGSSATVGVTTLNLETLRGPGPNGLRDLIPDFNGVIYIADVTGGGTNGSYNEGSGGDYETSGSDRKKHGIMLVNAGTLPNSEPSVPAAERYFTVVSDNAVYVKGDYNTGTTPTYTTDPVTGRQIATGSVASGTPYNAVTASIVADSVSVVSERFNPAFATAGINDYLRNGRFDANGEEGYVRAGPDLNSPPVLKRGAIPTTMNAAVVSGIRETDGGGAHNLVRFLENWRTTSSAPGSDYNGVRYFDPVLGDATSCPFTYLGSLIQLWRPKEFNGRWSNAWYNNPSRNFAFDHSFLIKSPVGPSVIVIYSRGTMINDGRTPYRRG